MHADAGADIPPDRIVTVDGPAGAGKSVLACSLAARLGYRHLDSGAIYRALTWAALDRGVPLDDAGRLADLCDRIDWRIEGTPEGMRVAVDGRGVDREIRTQEVTEACRRVVRHPAVRERVNRLQRDYARGGEGVVAEGRDIGTVVFPEARWKFYLDADLPVRARRRHAELVRFGDDVTVEEVARDLARRDTADRERSDGPLRVPPGAIRIDTTGLDIEGVVRAVLARVG